VYHKYDFVVTHEFSLRFKQPPAQAPVSTNRANAESKEVAGKAAGFFLLLSTRHYV
jgi:hypothetical protein